MYQLNTALLADILETVLDEEVVDIDTIGTIEVNYTAVVQTVSQKYLFKAIVRPPANESAARRFQKVQKIFHQLDETKITVPNIVYIEKTERKVGDHTIYAMMIQEYLPYSPLEDVWEKLSRKEKNEFAYSLGKTIKYIHTLKFDTFGPEGILRSDGQSKWRDYLFSLLDQLQSALRDNQYVQDELVTGVIKILKDNPEMIEYSGPPVLCHQDLWFGNLIIDPNNHLKFALVDWEWAEVLDPIMDLLWLDDLLFSDKDAISAFLESYNWDPIKHTTKIDAYNVIKSLQSAAEGFLYHNPTEKGYNSFSTRVSSFREKYS